MRRWRTDGALRRCGVAAAVAALLLAAGLLGRPDTGRAEPASAVSRHFSQAKLQRAGDFIRQEIAVGTIPGAVILIQQHGEPVYFESFGVRDVDSRRPMTADTIFRLYSMSKPVTSVAAMMLVEDGRLGLDDPVAKYIPAFGNVKVGVERLDGGAGPRLSLEPLARPITIEDLMRHTSGITYGFYGDSAVRKLYAGSDLFDGDIDNAQFVERLAKLPLAEQPGTRWDYGHSTDVLGRVVEVISGQSLLQFEKQRLLDPLGMTETAFFVADAAKLPRVAEPMPGGWFDRPVAGIKDPILPRRWESGGAGMVGTIGDYARFAQMLLNGGTLQGRRYLKPETIALMASDHIGPATGIVRDQLYFPGDTSGFGLGFAVRTAVPANTSWPSGEYRWDGVAGTFFFVDPRDDMFAIFMVQAPSQSGRIQQVLKTLIYEALGGLKRGFVAMRSEHSWPADGRTQDCYAWLKFIAAESIAMDAVTPKGPQTSDTHSHLVRPDSMEWQKTRFPGCEAKTLLFDHKTGLMTALMRFAPGAVLPDHEHVNIEQTYVLEGSLVDKEGPAKGIECKAGEFIWREQGSRHVAWCPQGGLMLAIFQVPNKFFEADGRVIDAAGQDWDETWGHTRKG